MHRRVVFIVVLFFFVSVDGFGFPTTTPCSCSKGPRCPPPPPPPLPCPPPPVYQPCPPAPIYQPPPPCPPVEPVAPPPPPVAPPPFSPLSSVNNCCHKCAAPCYYQPRRALGAKIFQAGNPIRSHRKNDGKCNSEELRKIMRLGMIGETRYSKRAIQSLAEDKLGGQFSVICSAGDFSYVVDTSFFCLETYNNLTCYAFQLEQI